MSMVIIRPRTTGAMWLRALFRYYCRKHECGVIWDPNGECHALGTPPLYEDAKRAEHEYEWQKARLLNITVDAIACNPEKHPATVIEETTRKFVKEVYRGKT